MHEIYKSLVARAPDAFATPLVRRLRAFAAEHQPGAAEEAGAGRLRLTGELVEAFCRAHPEAAFGVSVFQVGVARSQPTHTPNQQSNRPPPSARLPLAAGTCDRLRSP